MTSYANKNVDDKTWLVETLKKHTNLSDEEAQKVGEEIINAVQIYCDTKAALNIANSQGKTKEDWLKEFIDENIDTRNAEQVEYLAQAVSALENGNKTMTEILQSSDETSNVNLKINELARQEVSMPENFSADPFTVAEIKDNLANQSNLLGEQNVIAVDENHVTEEVTNIDTEILPKNLTEETETLLGTLSLKIGQLTDKISFLPQGTPIGILTGIAGIGIATVKSTVKCAKDEISVLEALENVGKASVSAVASFIKTGIPAQFLNIIPVAGPMLSFQVGLACCFMPKEKIEKNIYSGLKKIKNAAKIAAATVSNAWKTTKETLSNVANKVLSWI